MDYWIAFNQSEGIHDAQWREDSEYTQEMYLYDGSHGCVNTPLAAMKVIFENVIDGEAVVIY
ncbi:MAG: L,D-transpeptidase [Lachnospiraceae bacterium]|nr:L,D-transpeptidase [Lachnospiraceae bacterium]